MSYPKIDELKREDVTVYTTIIAAAKRARQLLDGAEPKISTDEIHPLEIAMQEILEEKVTYEPKVPEQQVIDAFAAPTEAIGVIIDDEPEV